MKHPSQQKLFLSTARPLERQTTTEAQLTSEPTLAFDAPKVNPTLYQCACGHQIAIGDTPTVTCSKCGRRVSFAAMDATQTMSFCVSSSSATHPNEGQEASQDRSGERLGHFLLDSKLGEGGMGEVYRALDESLRRYVAVKVMRSQKGKGSSADRVSRLLDEAVAQARVNHPNIVTIYFVGREAAEPFFAMELLPGPTLEAELRKGPFPYQQIIGYTSQVVSALTQASQLGLVHGDIKPSNLILSGPGFAKLGDFGLAKTSDMAATEGISGTLSYLAPELIDGEPPSEKSDMYALGVTLFEMTFGRRPYALRGSTLSDQLLNHRAAEIEFPEKWPKHLPEIWKKVLARLLEKDPRKRYADYDELRADLDALAPIGVTKAGWLIRTLALAVDLTVMGILMIPFIFPGIIVRIDSGLSAMPNMVGTICKILWPVALLTPAVPAFFAWMEWRGWQTPGRYLFQLRVVDSHGLPLNPKRRILRSLMRHSLIWLNSIAVAAFSVGLMPIGFGIGLVDELSLLINFLPILGPRRLVLHDRICGSHVVLDTISR